MRSIENLRGCCAERGLARWNWVAHNLVNPFVESAIVEPANGLANGINKLSQRHVIGHLPDLEIDKSSDYSAEFWAQSVAGALGSVLPYALAGKLTGGYLRGWGAALNLKGLAARVAASEHTAQILGGATYDGLKDLHAGETRLGNAAGAALSFSIYELSGSSSTRLSPLRRLGWRFATGASAASGQYALAHGAEVCRGKADVRHELIRAAVSGAVLGATLPAVQESAHKAEDRANLALGLGIPLPRHLQINIDQSIVGPANEIIRNAQQEHTWARVQTGAKEPVFDYRNDLVRIPSVDTNIEYVIHELKHRQEHHRKTAEPGFRLAAEYLRCGEERQAFRIYSAVRLGQETRARLAEEELVAAVDPSYKARDARSVKAQIPGINLAGDKTYEILWSEEFESFKSSNGCFRPAEDFSDGGEAKLEARRKKLLGLIKGRAGEVLELMEAVESRDDLQRPVVSKIYKELANNIVSMTELPKDRQPRRLAEDLLALVADPSRVVQGNHPTCAAASLEYIFYDKSPLLAVQLVNQVARRGAFRAADGTLISLPGALLIRKPQSDRSHANEIFQVTAVNIYWQRQTSSDYAQHVATPRFRYEPVKIRNAGSSPYRLLDYSSGQAGRPFIPGENMNDFDVADPHISSTALNDIHQQIKGVSNTSIVINKHCDQNSLREELLQSKAAGNLPAIIGLYMRNSAFGPAANTRLAGDYHAVVVKDFNPHTLKVSIFNPWGKEYSQSGMSLKELFLATEPTG